MAPDRLTKDVFINDFYLAVSGYKIWYKNVWDILTAVDLEESFINLHTIDIQQLKASLLEKQKREWLLLTLRKPKLRFYRVFKSVLEVERYVLLNLETSHRSVLAQLRFGILPLTIETGRFRNIPAEERYCPFCVNTVEDESHLLFNCCLYDDLRTSWLEYVWNDYPNFSDLCECEKLQLIMSQYARSTAKYVSKCMTRRKDRLNV